MKTINKISKSLLVFIYLLILPGISNAQKNQIGLRLGDLSGLSYRHTTEKQLALEVNLQKWVPYYNGTVLSVLGEKIWTLKNNFSAYAGAGIFISSLRLNHYYRYNRSYYYGSGDVEPNWGLEGVGGIEYKFKTAPFIIGVDVRPRIWGFLYPNFLDGGLNMRYMF